VLQAKHASLVSKHAELERQRAQLQGEQGMLQSTLEAKSGSAEAAKSGARSQASEHAGELARAHAELESLKQDTSFDLQQKASQVSFNGLVSRVNSCNLEPAMHFSSWIYRL
jgi:hypothetical protein